MVYSFGSWLKRRRKALDLSQQDLASRVGCSASAIFKIESDARRPSRQIAELLADHLQIPPEQRLQFLKVARQEKMVDSLEALTVPLEPFTPPAPAATTPQIPHLLTPLVGREHELSLIVAHLREPHCRLLTLTGIGGVGKTRLAFEAMDQLRESFTGGVYFVALAGVSDSRFILPAIADALDFLSLGSGDPGAQLRNYLREKEILLVLDNFEHLLQGVEQLIGILQAAPRVKFLVTSQVPLNLQAEWAFELQGLPVPASDSENIQQTSSAVQLFMQRARQARLGFELAPEDHPAVLHICQLVEGLPLGIELAATWVRAFSCGQIAVEIERNLDFLSTSARDLPERHRSIRAVLDHSWDLLSEQEQVVFRRLSVFRGGFHRDAAREVAGACLDEIASLLNKSLLMRSGEEHFHIRELVRQYAAAHLESDPQELERTQALYCRYYASQLEKWEAALRSPKQVEILTEMSAEMDNVRLAWSWMVARKDAADIGRSLLCMFHFHEIRGRFQSAVTLFEQAVEALQADVSKENGRETKLHALVGVLLSKQAFFCDQLGQSEQAGELMQQSLVLLRSTADRAALADALNHLAYLYYRQGDFERAGQSALESLGLNRELDRPFGIAYCLVILSYIHLGLGENEPAYQLANEGLAILRDNLGDPHGTVDSLIPLSRAAKQLGRYDQAIRWAREGLEISLALNDLWGTGQILRQLGLIHLELGETQEATNLLRQSTAQFREVGDRPVLARTLIDLGVAERASGSCFESKRDLLEAFRVAVETGAQANAWQALLEIASSEMDLGETERALELAVFILTNAASYQEVCERAGRMKAELQALLSPAQIETVQERVQHRVLLDYTHYTSL